MAGSAHRESHGCLPAPSRAAFPTTQPCLRGLRTGTQCRPALTQKPALKPAFSSAFAASPSQSPPESSSSFLPGQPGPHHSKAAALPLPPAFWRPPAVSSRGSSHRTRSAFPASRPLSSPLGEQGRLLCWCPQHHQAPPEILTDTGIHGPMQASWAYPWSYPSEMETKSGYLQTKARRAPASPGHGEDTGRGDGASK